jgi:Uncharacterized protein conserved in bacteria
LRRLPSTVAPGSDQRGAEAERHDRPHRADQSGHQRRACGRIGEKLRELITGRQFDRLVSRKSDRAGIEAYYSSHNYAPIWISNNAGSDRAKAAIAYLGLADAVGLDPNDYPTPDFKSATTADAVAEAELKLTASALTFARHAQIGRIHFTRVSADIQYDLAAPEPADVFGKARRQQRSGQGTRRLQSAAGRIQGAPSQTRRAAQGASACRNQDRAEARAATRPCSGWTKLLPPGHEKIRV